MPKPPVDLYIGDLVQMRKPHPCGGDTWRIVRLGAEIGIRCATCQRKVLLPRATFERRVKRFLERGAAGNTAPEDELE
jgi:hypothetical protein